MKLKQCKNRKNCVQADVYPDGWMSENMFSKRTNRCKKCQSLFVQSASDRPVDSRKSKIRLRAEAVQQAIIHECLKLGIPAKKAGLVDVCMWGCVNAEIKSSAINRFMINNTERIMGHLMILVSVNDSGIPDGIFIFPSTFSAFYYGGRLKSSVNVVKNPTHRNIKGTPLTKQDMEAHRNAWHLVEQMRLQISENLRYGIENGGRTSRPD